MFPDNVPQQIGFFFFPRNGYMKRIGRENTMSYNLLCARLTMCTILKIYFIFEDNNDLG